MQDEIYLVPAAITSDGLAALFTKLVLPDEPETIKYRIYKPLHISLTAQEQEGIMEASRGVKIPDDTLRSERLAEIREKHHRRALARMCQQHFGAKSAAHLLNFMNPFVTEYRMPSDQKLRTPARSMYGFFLPKADLDTLISPDQGDFEFAALTLEQFRMQYEQFERIINWDEVRLIEVTFAHLASKIA